MLKTKYIASILLAVAVMFAQIGIAAAAPSAQETTPLTGTIQTITTETDVNGVTTVLVTYSDDQGATQTVRLSTDAAVALGLITVDPLTNEVVVDETQVGQPVEIDPTTVIPDETTPETEEGPVNPISAILGAFFGEDSSVIDGYHEDGFGFGVIAQALWMSKNLNSDASLVDEILEAKQTGDYSAFVLEDGTSPSNWGQFKKAILEHKQNLGVVVSGHADSEESLDENGMPADSNTIEIQGNQDHGKGKNKDKNKGKGHDKNKHKP